MGTGTLFVRFGVTDVDTIELLLMRNGDVDLVLLEEAVEADAVVADCSNRFARSFTLGPLERSMLILLGISSGRMPAGDLLLSSRSVAVTVPLAPASKTSSMGSSLPN